MIEDDECTVVVHKDDSVEIDDGLNLVASPVPGRHEE